MGDRWPTADPMARAWVRNALPAWAMRCRTTPGRAWAPASPDGSTWITADAGIDARRELAQAPRAGGTPARHRRRADPARLPRMGATSPSCSATAAFAIWDGKIRCLSARQSLGVKPPLRAWARARSSVQHVDRVRRYLRVDAPDDLATPISAVRPEPGPVVDRRRFRSRLAPAHLLWASRGTS